ncbi:AmpG family muropeptide MFS transporter [Glaesserella sp.]|uniref:AmpG family muropeptide MFS transporter n=1 Tax=Glaesserella sp. TaxID=2094731 RepID=UPI0035A1966D
MSETVIKPSVWQQLFNKKVLQCFLTGFTSGLPLYFIVQLVPAWLRSEQIDLKTIGFFTLIGFPYTWKFLISPLLDRYYPNFLGRRRSWMFITQVCLIGLLTAFAFLQPKEHIGTIAVIAAFVAVFSSLQDIVVDAYRRELLSDEELGIGNATHVNAYRIAGLIPGGVSLILSDYYSWETVFIFTSLFMIPGILLSLLFKEPKVDYTVEHLSFNQAFVAPFKEFLGRKGVKESLAILLFIFLYKFGDSFAATLQTTFVLDMGFSRTDLGTAVKVNGLIAVLISGTIGGLMLPKLGLNKALWIFGFIQVITTAGFAWLASYGKFEVIGGYERFALSLVIIMENVGVGLGTACFLSYISLQTNPLYTATQFAIFTSLAAVPSKILGATAGIWAQTYGYEVFYWICVAAGIPGMLMLLKVAPWHQKQTI